MDQPTPTNIAGSFSDEEHGPTFNVDRPRHQSIPFVFASPHSGSHYLASFVSASRLDSLSLRRSEDSFVDELYAEAPHCGAPLLKALFPRAYVDPNREAYELDPRMFEEPLPKYVNTSSSRVFAGLGTVPRVVTTARPADIASISETGKFSASDGRTKISDDS